MKIEDLKSEKLKEDLTKVLEGYIDKDSKYTKVLKDTFEKMAIEKMPKVVKDLVYSDGKKALRGDLIEIVDRTGLVCNVGTKGVVLAFSQDKEYEYVDIKWCEPLGTGLRGLQIDGGYFFKTLKLVERYQQGSEKDLELAYKIIDKGKEGKRKSRIKVTDTEVVIK